MRKIFHLDKVGQEIHPGMQYPLYAAGYLFDQPGAGSAPHTVDPERKLLGQILLLFEGGDYFRLRSRRLALGQVLFVPWNDARRQASPVDFGILEIIRRAIGIVEDYLEYGLAAEAAEEKLPAIN